MEISIILCVYGMYSKNAPFIPTHFREAEKKIYSDYPIFSGNIDYGIQIFKSLVVYVSMMYYAFIMFVKDEIPSI